MSTSSTEAAVHRTQRKNEVGIIVERVTDQASASHHLPLTLLEPSMSYSHHRPVPGSWSIDERSRLA